MTWSSKHLTCENTYAVDGFSVGKKMDMWHWAFQHRQLGHYIQEGRSMWLQEGPSFPQGPKDQNGLAAVRSISGSQRKFICSFIHSFQKCKFRSLLPMWASYLLSKWPNSNLSGDKITFIFAETSQSTGDQEAGLRAPLSYTHGVKVLESGPVLLFSKQKHFLSPQ